MGTGDALPVVDDDVSPPDEEENKTEVRYKRRQIPKHEASESPEEAANWGAQASKVTSTLLPWVRIKNPKMPSKNSR